MSRRHTLFQAEVRPSARGGPSRREALAGLLAAAAGAMSGCSPPQETIEPYAFDPTTYDQGLTTRYATTLTLGGYGRGVLGLVCDGRPIKIEGNPRHPASMGATDVFAEAAVLDLFDPQRSKAPWSRAAPVSWSALTGAAMRRLGQAGDRAWLLTGRITSPTAWRAIHRLQAAYPGLQHVRYEPVHDDAALAGAVLATGRRLACRPDLARADVVVCLGADPLGPGPEQMALARAYASRRRPEAGPVSRWYVFEPTMTLSGACADERVAVRPELIRNVALALAQGLGGEPQTLPLPEAARRLSALAARDLAANPGKALVLVGRGQPAEVHAFAAALNARLQAPLTWSAPVDPVEEPHDEALSRLAAALHGGQVDSLVVADCNPLYDAPAALGLHEGLSRASYSLHAGLYRDETAAACRWHAPLSHALESWGDARGPGGEASLAQPLVQTLYDTRTLPVFLEGLAGTSPSAQDLVRDTWRERADGAFDSWWRRALIEGVIAEPKAGEAAPSIRRVELAPAAASGALVLTLAPSATVWDGSRAANAWLQECPDPLTKEVWGSALRIGAADAERLGIADGELVAMTRGGASVEAPVRLVSGQAAGVVSMTLGGGRYDGLLADGVGADAGKLREGLGWDVEGVRLTPTGRHAPSLITPSDIRLEGELAKLFPVVEPGEATPPPEPLPSLFPARPPLPQREVAWAMVIDSSACIGCNACVVACQAENNVPVIGPEEIAANRDMHWLRVDRYDTGDAQDPRPGFQPVPCMHCETAPCEPVCPVEASVHDSSGLNVQVYNRCIGTRFCEANCPYKVRRFNFKDYAEPKVYPVEDARSVEAQRNPEVTVRARGVMEKCTYCVQRISAARREAERTDEPRTAAQVKTACQQACPAEAIVFGDLNDPESAVSRLRRSKRHHVLLEELGTRPRTTYLAKVRTRRGGPA